MNHKHGHKRVGRATAEYIAWGNMKKRCYDTAVPDFKNYGGRGIAVCAKWRNSYLAFFNDVGPRPTRRHTLDRIDNDGDYEPGNCRWTTRKVQGANRRNVHRIPFGGRVWTLPKLAAHLGVQYRTLYWRMKAGTRLDAPIRN